MSLQPWGGDKQILVELATYFEEPLTLPHRWNARRKYLGESSFEDCSFDLLLGYIHYLVDKKWGQEVMNHSPKPEVSNA
jgi:hypothetical protein